MRIVCLTSNDYINCLEPFAYYWNKFAGDRRQVTVAHYDVAPTHLPDNFEMIEIGKQADYSWSSGLRKALEVVNDEVVLLLLEDYFMCAPVDWGRIDELEFWMQHAWLTVGKVDLTGDRLKTPHTVVSADLVRSNLDAPFQASLQAALWQSELLRLLLNASENAWQFEKHATNRLSEIRHQGRYTGGILGTRCPAMSYANAVGGAGGKPGVIEAKHMPRWMFEECVAKGWAHG